MSQSHVRGGGGGGGGRRGNFAEIPTFSAARSTTGKHTSKIIKSKKMKKGGKTKRRIQLKGGAVKNEKGNTRSILYNLFFLFKDENERSSRGSGEGGGEKALLLSLETKTEMKFRFRQLKKARV